MAKTFTVTPVRRMRDRMVSTLVRLGVAPRRVHLLTVVGRKTGVPRSTPVTLVENPEGRWLVAPFGPVNWVWNARAAGVVTLRRGNFTERVKVIEAGAQRAAPVLKQYVTDNAIVRPYFDVTPNSSIEEFRDVASRHPVFEIISTY